MQADISACMKASVIRELIPDIFSTSLHITLCSLIPCLLHKCFHKSSQDFVVTNYITPLSFL